jgi:sugar phosphate isomerase/epimerase
MINFLPLDNLSRLCIHTITTKPWNIEEASKNYSASGVKGITVWRDAISGRNIKQTGEMLRQDGLKIVSLCRGGFFAAKEHSRRQSAIDENRRTIDEAHELGTSLIVLVCGADPAQPLDDSRKQIYDGIADILPDAQAAGVRLAIEPLHPMYSDTRSAINTLAQANDMAESFNSPLVGVAVDVYHVWWDPQLETEIKRCGKKKNILAFHICDWKSPTVDMLNDRGIMGEGCIPLRKIRSWVEAAGFDGFIEVEIFSTYYWKQEQSGFLKNIITAYKTYSLNY